MVEETLKMELEKNLAADSKGSVMQAPLLRKRLQIFEKITLTKTSGKKKSKKGIKIVA